MTASDKMTPDEPEKTFLSFSDKINDSVVVKSMEDQSLLINPDDKQENICLRTPSIKADDNKFVTDTVKEEAPINLNISQRNKESQKVSSFSLRQKSDKKPENLSPSTEQHVTVGDDAD